MKATWASLFLGATLLSGSAGAMGTAPDTSVQLPQRLMFGTEILEEIHRQTGRRYAYPTGVLLHQLDTTPFDGQADVLDLVARVAPNATIDLQNDLLIFSADVADETLRELQAELADPDPDTRRLAAYRLGNLQSMQTLPLLYEALNDENASVRHHALRSLLRLEKDFRKHSPPGRVSVLAATGDVPARTLTDLMANVQDRGEHEWMWSVELLGRARHDDAAPSVREGLSHGYAGVREQAQWTLDRFESNGDRETPNGLRWDPAALLQAERAEENPLKRAEIILKLGRAGGAEVWSRLLVLIQEEDPVLRRAALRALRRCPDAAAVAPLLEWVKGEGVESEDRNLAAMSLGLIASEPAVEALSAYILEAELPMSASVLGLGYTRDERALPALIRAASWPGRGDRVLKGYAFMGLARLGGSEAVDALLENRGQWSNIARAIAYAAIRHAGAWNQSAVDAFVEKVMNGHPVAPHGLEMAEDPRAVDALLAQLPDSKGSQRLRIVQSLGRIGDPKAAPGLLAVMNEAESMRDQYIAMRALRWRWFWNRPEVQAGLAAHPRFRAFVEPVPSLEEQEENTWVLRRWPVDFDDHR